MVVWTSTLTSFELLGIAPTTAPVVKSHVNVLWAVAITLSGSLACSVLERTEVYFQRKGRLQARQLAHSPPLASATEGRGDAAAAAAVAGGGARVRRRPLRRTLRQPLHRSLYWPLRFSKAHDDAPRP